MSEDNFSFSENNKPGTAEGAQSPGAARSARPGEDAQISEGFTQPGAAARGAASPKGSAKNPKGFDLEQGVPVQGVYFFPDPDEIARRKKWRKRHPKLFWGLILFGLFFIFNIFGSVYMALDEEGHFSGPRIGVARIEGMILDSADIVAWLDYLQHNNSVHGVLLYINSGGGAVVPSQEIHAAVARLAADKPVVAYMSTAAASGGYYAAVAADYIVASPSTLTGSIGVRMELANMQKLFETIGVGQQTLSSGPMKEAGTPFRPLRPDEEEYLQSIVQDMYEVFIADVAAGRKMPVEDVRGIADGRAYTGRQAFNLGLIDELGDSVAALDRLHEFAGLDQRVNEYLDGPQKKESFMQNMISGAIGDALKEVNAARPNSPMFYY